MPESSGGCILVAKTSVGYEVNQMATAVLVLLLALVSAAPSAGQMVRDIGPEQLGAGDLADGLDVALAAERTAYAGLDDEGARRRFRTLFWTRRDPDPRDFDNPVREDLHQRARRADALYGTGNLPGRQTDRGRALVLLGEPARVADGRDVVIFAYAQAPGTAEPFEIRFTRHAGDVRFDAEDTARAVLERARDALVMSPSLPYAPVATDLPLPDVAGVEWSEMSATREQYERAGRKGDFTLDARLNFVRAARDRARAYIDIVVSGDEVVRPGPGLGDSRHVGIAGLLVSTTTGEEIPIRDALRLDGPAARGRVRIPLELAPGDYRLTLLAREPAASLLAFREDRFRVPDYGLDRLEVSSLMCGLAGEPDRARSDLALDFRSGAVVVEPGTRPASGGTWRALLHVYGARGPVSVRFFVDGADVTPREVWRGGELPEQTIGATLTEWGRVLMVMVHDPVRDQGLVVARELGEPRGATPLASRRARAEDLGRATTMPAHLVSPAPGENPLAATEAEAVRQGDGGVAIFVDDELQAFASRSPVKVPLQFLPGMRTMTVAAASLDGLLHGRLGHGPLEGVTLKPRTAAFSVRTTLVPVYATVEDVRAAHIVPDLDQDSFRIVEEGKEQAISHFERATKDAISVAFVLDESTAMGPMLDAARTALAGMAAGLRPEDRGLVVGFADEVIVRSDLTDCKGCLVAALQSSRLADPLRAPLEIRQRETAYRRDRPADVVASEPMREGAMDSPPRVDVPTAAEMVTLTEANASHGRLMDALEAATFRLATLAGRKVVVVVGTGDDSGSRIGVERITDLVRRYGVTLYAVGLDVHPDVSVAGLSEAPGRSSVALRGADRERMRRTESRRRDETKELWEAHQRAARNLTVLADVSGGRAVVIDSPKAEELDLVDLVGAVEDELRAQYFVGFYARDAERPGMHSIRVEVREDGLRARARTGYFALATSPP